VCVCVYAYAYIYVYIHTQVCKQEAQHQDHVARLESEWRAIHTRLEDARRDEVMIFRFFSLPMSMLTYADVC
jgi:murein tripeptide amidase MpaA